MDKEEGTTSCSTTPIVLIMLGLKMVLLSLKHVQRHTLAQMERDIIHLLDYVQPIKEIGGMEESRLVFSFLLDKDFGLHSGCFQQIGSMVVGQHLEK